MDIETKRNEINLILGIARKTKDLEAKAKLLDAAIDLQNDLINQLHTQSTWAPKETEPTLITLPKRL